MPLALGAEALRAEVAESWNHDPVGIGEFERVEQTDEGGGADDHCGVAVGAPVTTTAGALVAEVDGGIWCLFPWAAGVVALSLSQAASLGAHLGCLHVSLGQVFGQGLLPAVPDTVTADVTSPQREVEKSHRLSKAAERGDGVFDVAAAAALDHR
ncbi:hypothetical protein [Streptomyces sp. NPDC090080]|uniref:hypothetical protein n=1 Tax=Streptomyces sp. NPDC090080 TaxID=3365939 RepID=UPI00382991FE